MKHILVASFSNSPKTASFLAAGHHGPGQSVWCRCISWYQSSFSIRWKMNQIQVCRPTSISVFRFGPWISGIMLGHPTSKLSLGWSLERSTQLATPIEIRLFRQYAMLLYSPAFPVPPSSHPNQNPDTYPCQTKIVPKDLHSTLCDKCIFLVWAKGTAPIKGFLQHI